MCFCHVNFILRASKSAGLSVEYIFKIWKILLHIESKLQNYHIDSLFKIVFLLKGSRSLVRLRKPILAKVFVRRFP